MIAQCAMANLFVMSAGSAVAQSITYQYDELGRLKKATYGSGAVTEYTYDAAGNRTLVNTSAPFVATVTITGSGPADLRSLANAAGYTGGDANVTFVNAGTITGNSGGPGVDTGTWPAGYTIGLTLSNTGTIRGGGGPGGGVGGDAIYARFALTINNAGGTLQGGGGGGGPGGEWTSYQYDGEGVLVQTKDWLSGGGGGGWPNGSGGPEGGPAIPADIVTDNANPGSAGTTSGGGAGGAGGSAGTGRATGAGGAGGGIATAGATGSVATGTETTSGSIIRTKTSPISGGAAGYAVRKNGNTVTRTGGTVSGAEG